MKNSEPRLSPFSDGPARVLSRARKTVLAGTVAVLALGSAGLGTQAVLTGTTANAQSVSAETPQAAVPFSFADVVERVSPAVVSVRVTGQQDENMAGNMVPGMPDLPEDHPLRDFFERFGPRMSPEGRSGPRRFSQGQGSGFIITDDGYIVTNNHVVERGEKITVVLNDETELEAEVVGTDTRTDLAVLKVETDRTLPFVEFGNDGATRIGDWVVAVGNPFGLGGSVTAGIVSARGRDIGAGPYDDFLQIDAPVNRGNSGGPTFNLAGEVIGVNTAIFSPSGGNVGIAFAISASTAKDVVAELMESGEVTRGWLGVQIQPVTEEIAEGLGLERPEGALVSEVTEGSPAETAGIEVGDAVIGLNGETVLSPRDLARKVAQINPKQEAQVTVWRDGEEQQVGVTIGTLPQQVAAATPEEPEESAEDDGLELGSLGLELSQEGGGEPGVLITEVTPDSPASEKGLQAGDRIMQVGGDAVTKAGEVAEKVRGASEAGRKSVLFLVRSGEASRFVALSPTG